MYILPKLKTPFNNNVDRAEEHNQEQQVNYIDHDTEAQLKAYRLIHQEKNKIRKNQ